MTRRRLRPDEIELWQRVTETTHRLHPERLVKDLPKPKPKPTKTLNPSYQDFKVGQKAKKTLPKNDILPLLSDRLAKLPINMDQKAYRSLKRGKSAPEGKIDLHGMTLDQAHPALTSFVLRSHRSGKRLLLVITGKGRISEPYGKRGVLKHQVPQWLSLPPLSGAILQISEAHLKHGGSGAYYIYLRRSR